MSTPRFVHDDIVTLTETGQIGTVKEVHQTGSEYVYGIQLKTAACETVEVPEAQLELVKIANEDETGFHIRYIT
jgi:ribosomal 30S subunit maturation factor RimM